MEEAVDVASLVEEVVVASLVVCVHQVEVVPQVEVAHQEVAHQEVAVVVHYLGHLEVDIDHLVDTGHLGVMVVEIPEYLAVYQAAQTNANQMREMYNKLVNDIEEMESRKNILKGKAAATRARETVNKMGSKSSRYGAASGKMADMESRIDARFNTAMAESELLNTPQDETEALRDKYKGGTSHSVNDELDRLAAELGLGPEPTVE